MGFASLWRPSLSFRRCNGFLFADFMMILLQKLQCTALDGVHTGGLEVFCAPATQV